MQIRYMNKFSSTCGRTCTLIVKNIYLFIKKSNIFLNIFHTESKSTVAIIKQHRNGVIREKRCKDHKIHQRHR